MKFQIDKRLKWEKRTRKVLDDSMEDFITFVWERPFQLWLKIQKKKEKANNITNKKKSRRTQNALQRWRAGQAAWGVQKKRQPVLASEKDLKVQQSELVSTLGEPIPGWGFYRQLLGVLTPENQRSDGISTPIILGKKKTSGKDC
jgi:hypothetical protein